ncbi:hypothetical protein EIP91_010527 [Steccherinum ochraceum]|uniref:Uncharacterized protein n=1 Tax=Steccherinum ochraceum TaxID=92696 RepID=A0A4R0R0I5_9APHY|nr:hypothetical protein EIP91_010527 [Steccherinum ochraceum]
MDAHPRLTTANLEIYSTASADLPAFEPVPSRYTQVRAERHPSSHTLPSEEVQRESFDAEADALANHEHMAQNEGMHQQSYQRPTRQDDDEDEAEWHLNSYPTLSENDFTTAVHSDLDFSSPTYYLRRILGVCCRGHTSVLEQPGNDFEDHFTPVEFEDL